jgi:oxygen-independent coproporphyrinogen-3 oxidase
MIQPSDSAGSEKHAATILNLELIRRYSIPGPRYTSYPPATLFTGELEKLRLEEAIADDNKPGAGPISLYFHLPFCETRCWFCGCNTVITARHEYSGEYLQTLASEVEMTARLLDPSRPVVQVHFGGGTPTFFRPDELRRLGELIRRHFKLSADCEYGVEIDPRRLSLDHLTALREIGANRVSLGVQDTDGKVQLAVHRWQPHDLNKRVVRWVRESGFHSINVDLIYGLPLQTSDSFRKTVDDVLELGAERFSVFSYAHVPWIKPSQKIFDDRGQLPGPEEKLSMFEVAHHSLMGAGYVDIGLDHFARPTDELALAQRAGTLQRNFQGYSTRAGASLYGFGMSSISSTADSYRQNHKTLPAWRDAVAAGRLPIERGLRLGEEDKRRRTIIMRIMCDRKLDYAAISKLIGVDFASSYARELASLKDLERDGIVECGPTSLVVTPVGVPLLRVVAMRFDATFVAGPRRHAQTV